MISHDFLTLASGDAELAALLQEYSSLCSACIGPYGGMLGEGGASGPTITNEGKDQIRQIYLNSGDKQSLFIKAEQLAIKGGMSSELGQELGDDARIPGVLFILANEV